MSTNMLEPSSIKQILAVNKINLNKDKFMLWVTFKDVYGDKYDGYLRTDLNVTNITNKGLGVLDPEIKKFSSIQESDVYVQKLKDLVNWREEENFILITVKYKVDDNFNLDAQLNALNGNGKVVQIGKPNDDTILTSIDDARLFKDKLILIQKLAEEDNNE